MDARLHTLDRVLADLKRPTRAFLYTWLTIQAISIAYSVTLAVQADDNATRGNNIVTASFAATSMSGLLLAPSPGRYASREYRALPQATSEEKRHKLDQGERWLQRQARSDALGTWWVRHVLTALGAAGAGVGLALGYENNLEGAVRVAVSTFVAGELLIWTRPTRSIRYARQHLRSNEQPPQLSLAPLADRYAQGLSLVGRF